MFIYFCCRQILLVLRGEFILFISVLVVPGAFPPLLWGSQIPSSSHGPRCKFLLVPNWTGLVTASIYRAQGSLETMAARPTSLSSLSSSNSCRPVEIASCIAWSRKPCWDIPTWSAPPWRRRCHGKKAKLWTLRMWSPVKPTVMHPEFSAHK